MTVGIREKVVREWSCEAQVVALRPPVEGGYVAFGSKCTWILVGATKPSQLDDNLQAADVQLTPEEVRDLDELSFPAGSRRRSRPSAAVYRRDQIRTPPFGRGASETAPEAPGGQREAQGTFIAPPRPHAEG